MHEPDYAIIQLKSILNEYSLVIPKKPARCSPEIIKYITSIVCLTKINIDLDYSISVYYTTQGEVGIRSRSLTKDIIEAYENDDYKSMFVPKQFSLPKKTKEIIKRTLECLHPPEGITIETWASVVGTYHGLKNSLDANDFIETLICSFDDLIPYMLHIEQDLIRITEITCQ